MLSMYERVDGPYRSRKHEFVYEDGYPLREGRMFWLVYTKKGKIEMFVDHESIPLFPRDSKNKTNFGTYTESYKGALSRETYLKSFQPTITDEIRSKGEILRGFATYLLDVDKGIFEIDPKLIGDGSFYRTLTINWKISGIKEEVRKQNQEQLELADETLKGMRFLLDPLEFYDVVEETDYSTGIQEKLNRLKHY